jgi:outer membrane murein-binding lipoprotein Lpp
MKNLSRLGLAAAVLALLSATVLAGCAAAQPKSGPAADHPQAVPRSRTM